MAILQPADLLVVYKPEYGFVSTLSKENINASDLLNDSGEAYSISTTPKGSLINDSGEEEDYTSPAQGLTLNLKIRSGTIVDMSVVSGGFDYVVGELVDVDGGDQCVLISSVNEIGGVVEASLYSGEGGYSITSGLLTDFPYGYHDTIMNTVHPLEGGPNSGNFVDIRVEDNVVTGAYIGSKVFESDTEFEGQKFTVGEEVHILADKTNAGLHIQSSVLSVLEPESGGPAKFSVSNLESDVKSWASEVMPTIDVVIQENDGSFDHGSTWFV